MVAVQMLPSGSKTIDHLAMKSFENSLVLINISLLYLRNSDWLEYYAYLPSIDRTKFRQQMNRADQEAGNKVIDSLINYETVKVCL